MWAIANVSKTNVGKDCCLAVPAESDQVQHELCSVYHDSKTLETKPTYEIVLEQYVL